MDEEFLFIDLLAPTGGPAWPGTPRRRLGLAGQPSDAASAAGARTADEPAGIHGSNG